MSLAIINIAEPPPSVNNLFVNVRGKGRVRSDRYKTWLNAAGWDVLQARVKPIHGKVRMALIVARPNRRADLDNRLKAIGDLLVHQGVLIDDSQIESISAEWSDTIPGCRVVIERWSAA